MTPGLAQPKEHKKAAPIMIYHGYIQDIPEERYRLPSRLDIQRQHLQAKRDRFALLQDQPRRSVFIPVVRKGRHGLGLALISFGSWLVRETAASQHQPDFAARR